MKNNKVFKTLCIVYIIVLPFIVIELPYMYRGLAPVLLVLLASSYGLKYGILSAIYSSSTIIFIGHAFHSEYLLPIILKSIIVYFSIVIIYGRVKDLEEKKLKEVNYQKNRRETLFKSSHDSIAIVDKDFKIIDINDKFVETFGYSPDEALGDKLNNLIVDEDYKDEGEDLDYDAKNGKIINFETVRKDKYGNKINVVVKSHPILDENGEIDFYLDIYTNITKRKKVENELKRSEKEKQIILDSMTDNVIYHDKDLRILWANNEAIKSLNRPQKDIIGSYCHDIYRNNKEVCPECPLPKAIETKEIQSEEIYHQDGKAFLTKGIPVLGDDSEVIGVLNVTTDITEIKKAEKSIKKSLEEKDILLQEIHHRVKNNLQVISSLINLQAGESKDIECLEMFETTKNRIKSIALIHEQLYKSNDFSVINLSEYFNLLIDNIQSSQRINDFLEFEIEGQDLELDIDTITTLGLITNELISNSIEHGFKEKDQGKITINYSTKEDICRLIIKDNGQGFPSDEIQENQGLGLQLVNAMVDQIDGSLEIKNKNGTEFIIEFPLSKEKGGVSELI